MQPNTKPTTTTTNNTVVKSNRLRPTGAPTSATAAADSTEGPTSKGLAKVTSGAQGFFKHDLSGMVSRCFVLLQKQLFSIYWVGFETLLFKKRRYGCVENGGIKMPLEHRHNVESQLEHPQTIGV